VAQLLFWVAGIQGGDISGGGDINGGGGGIGTPPPFLRLNNQ
jgi:hypothetical protein